jgi:DNA helicase-2/ATP-dependent DNA helicase PcrA
VHDLNAERQALVKTEGHLLVMGGPGSGKTSIALLKADREVQSSALRGGQKILFLSFARATIARVAERAGSLIAKSSRDLIEIDTYHGFIWHLLRGHGYLLSPTKKIRLLPPPQAAAHLSIFNDLGEGRAEIRRLFFEDGILHFDLFAEVAATLLTASPTLLRIYSAAYPIIVLDEFQDTNTEEWRLIQLLGINSRLIALADSEQRIYEFRGADPARIEEFKSAFKPTIFDFGTENHRSNGKDIVLFGNELLSAKNKGKVYKDVAIATYGFYRGRSQIFQLKASVIGAIKRCIRRGEANWSIAVLVPSKKLMLQVSDYLGAASDGLPAVTHDVALDTEGPALAAIAVACVLEGDLSEEKVARKLISNICLYLKGRRGSDGPTQADSELAGALDTYLKNGAIRGKKRLQLVASAVEVSRRRFALVLSGDPAADWLIVRDMFSEFGVDVFGQIVDDAKYLRLLHKGAVLRARLGELWRQERSYLGASDAVQNALLQEHFSAATKVWRGVNVMTIHKSKGKEFTEVIVYEGTHSGKIVWPNATDREKQQALLALRVAVTRATHRATIMTPAGDVCPFL